MMGIKDWVLSQLVSKSLASARPLSGSDSFIDDGRLGNEMSIQGAAAHTTNLVSSPEAADVSLSSVAIEENMQQSPPQVVIENSHQPRQRTDEKKLEPLARVEELQIKFLRLLQRLGHSKGDLMVAKVLYRMHLATLIRAGGADLRRADLGNDKARAIAAEQEASGLPKLDFSLRVLVLGKTRVGKSATINSIFDQTKAQTDTFQPGTRRVQEIVGIVNGIKISFIDTPGLLPLSPTTVRKNRKILHSVKRFIKKSPPDMVLYFERLDLIDIGYSDFPLLKLITEVFGSAIWFNTILVMTHSSAALPEGPNGYPVSYEPYLTRCAEMVRHSIHQAVSDSKLENPVLFVENHPQCKKNISGEKILLNGQVWKPQFLLLCLCTKILADVNNLLEFQDRIELGSLNNNRLPSLPHLLSSFLQHHMLNPNGAEDEFIDNSLSYVEEEDEYDLLPPIRILTKTQFERLTSSEKKDYLDELDYRETLYLKKQLKEEYLRRRDKKQDESLAGDDDSDNQGQQPEAVVLPDMAVPPSFDSDCPVHRYRCLVTSDQWLARPVLDPHGWDHDVSFDGINLETISKINKNIFASVAGQFSKDKQDFSIQSECSAAFVDPRGPAYSVGLDVQSSGKELIYTLHSSTKLSNIKHNTPECGVSVMSFANKHYVGAKLEDSFSIGKRLKFMVNAGRMGSVGQVAYGGKFEATIRGEDYPVRNDKVSLSMTLLSMSKETVLGGNIDAEFRLSRGTKMSVGANLNSRSMGQICIKTSSSEHMELALIAAVSIFRGLLRRKAPNGQSAEKLEMG